MRRALAASALAFILAARASAATFTVNTVADGHDATPIDGVCETATGNGICTLRAAIEETSALGGTSTIDVPAGTYMLGVLDDGKQILQGVGALRNAVHCPDDAPPG